MPNLTFKERLAAGLLALGYVPDPTDRSRYSAYTKPGHKNKLFIGESGALRCGECASRSFSIGCPADMTPKYAFVLDKGTPKETQFE